MRAEDLTVEVRRNPQTAAEDEPKNVFRRVAGIPLDALDILVQDVFNGVGSWTITLPEGHPAVEHLEKPGAGIVVSLSGTEVFSGPMTQVTYSAGPNDTGDVIFNGVSDDIFLADTIVEGLMRVSGLGTTTQLMDPLRTAVAETLMHEYVYNELSADANWGSDDDLPTPGPLVMGTDEGRGVSMTRNPQYERLLDVVSEIADASGFLGFRCIQRGDYVTFETYERLDRSSLIRMDIRTGSLTQQQVTISCPEVSEVLVAAAGQAEDNIEPEEGGDRPVVMHGGVSDWNRNIQKFVDRRDFTLWADDDHDAVAFYRITEDEYNKYNHRGVVQAKAVPSDDAPWLYGRDWQLGDVIAVVLGDTEHTEKVTGMALRANPSTVSAGAILGDFARVDNTAAISGKFQSTDARVSNLERNFVRSTGGADTGWTLDIDGTHAEYTYHENRAEFNEELRVNSSGFIWNDGATWLNGDTDVSGGDLTVNTINGDAYPPPSTPIGYSRGASAPNVFISGSAAHPTGGMSLTFQAPADGVVRVHFAARINKTDATGTGMLNASFDVYNTTTSTSFLAESQFGHWVETDIQGEQTLDHTCLVVGLTPGDTYRVQDFFSYLLGSGSGCRLRTNLLEISLGA